MPSHKRIRLCGVAGEKPRSITELAAVLQSNGKAVHRDVEALHSVGILLLRKGSNPGHGQVRVVTAAASRFQLVAGSDERGTARTFVLIMI